MRLKINKVRVRKDGILSEAQDFIVGDDQVQNDEEVKVLKNLATEEDIDALFPTQVEES